MNNNNKKRIFIAVIFILLLFFLLTFAGGRSEVALVEFIDGFDNSVIDSQEVEIGDDAVVPEDPKHKNYVFAGWFLFEDHDIKVTDFTDIEEDLKVIALYAGDANNNGIADDQDDRFVVTFKDGLTNDVIKTESVIVGLNATAPNAPTHRGYTFIGWDKGYTNIVENTTVTAEYERNEVAVTMYTVTFIDGDTREVIATQKVQEGKAATLPEAPKHENRVFVEWAGEYSNVKENTTITAIYADDMNNDGIEDATQPHYDVTYYDYNNEVIEVIEDVLVDMPTPTIADPERQYYKFNGWNPEVAETVTDNADYTATYVPVTDENGNGKADEEEAHFTITYYRDSACKEVYAVKENVLVDTLTPTVENPTREFYEFKGWNPTNENVIVKDNANYCATWKAKNDSNGDQVADEEQYLIEFYSDNKLVDGNYYNPNATVTAPVLEDTDTDNRVHTGWNPTFNDIATKAERYDAVWAEDMNNNGKADEGEAHFTITYNVDGQTFKVFEDVLVDTKTPVPAKKPEKTDYVFVNWGEVAKFVTEDATYNAVWADDKNNNGTPDDKDIYYDVTYQYDEKNIIDTISVLVNMPTPTIADPTKTNYHFVSWDPAIAKTVTGKAVYTAVFAPDHDENGNGIADEEELYFNISYVDVTDAGTETYYSTSVLINMPTPIISDPDKLNYVFTGWNPVPAEKVTEKATYYATWADDKNNNDIADNDDTYHIVTFVDGHTGNTIDTQRVLTKMAATEPTAPTHEGYVFTGWSEDFSKVESNLTVTAEYAEDKNGDQIPDSEQTLWEVRFYNEGVQIGNVQYVVDGEAAVAPTNPTKNGYSFNGWDKEFSNVTSNLDVNATFVDDIAPSVSASTSLDVDKNISTVTVTTTDAGTGVKVVKHLRGEHTAEEVLEKGNDITSTGKFEEDVNGIHTIYAEDNAGNVTVTTIEITDIVFTPGDDFFDKYVTFDFGDIYGWYNSVVNLTANEDVKIKKIRIYQSDDSLLQAGCEIFGWCETRSRYATMAEMENNAAVPEDMVELDLTGKYNENGFIEPLTISTDASPDRFTIYVELDYKGQTVKRLYKFRLAHIAGQ